MIPLPPPAGQVFSWGANSFGQLGLGKDVLSQLTPTSMCSLTGVAVTQISAGGNHTLVLTLPGLVYCCGANKAGQLGVNRVDERGKCQWSRVYTGLYSIAT